MSHELAMMITRDLHVLSIVFLAAVPVIVAVALWAEWKS